MTTEQESQFLRFGCTPRCLIKLTEKIQKPVSRDEFCRRFAHCFHDPQTQYGLLNPDCIPEIARSLSLPSTGPQSSPTKLVPLEDYDKVAILHSGGALVLIASNINLNEGATDPLGNCSVLDKIDTQTFTLWTPAQDGKDYVLPPFSIEQWAIKQCKGMVFV
jgi:hypothetical protein